MMQTNRKFICDSIRGWLHLTNEITPYRKKETTQLKPSQSTEENVGFSLLELEENIDFV